MTLIVGIPADDGVVFASDTQVTIGEVRANTTKIFQLNPGVLWGGSGDVALIQRVAERLARLPDRDKPLSILRDVLAITVKDAVHDLLATDFRTDFFRSDPGNLLRLYQGDFLFVEYQQQSPNMLHVLITGTPEWIDGRFAVTGNGDLFAHALLHKYEGARLSLEPAKLLAYKVLEEAIQVGSYGLGYPIDVWQITSSGTNRLEDNQLALLADAAHVLRGLEVTLLTESAARYANSTAVQQANTSTEVPPISGETNQGTL